MHSRLLIRSTQLIALVLTATLCSGCTLSGVVRQVVKQATEKNSSEGDTAYIAKMAAVDGGPGIIVAEPSVTGTPSNSGRGDDLAAFGAGCGRWLNLHVGGHGEFGQTPFWGHADDARVAMNQTYLRFTPDDVEKVATLTGVTHVAIGQIKTKGTQATLTYQLYQAHPTKKPVGAPLTLNGTRTQIVERLPQMARDLSKGLGLSTPRVPAVKISAAEMSLLGQTPWKAQQPVASALAAQLLALSSREPLAGVLFLRSDTMKNDDDARLPVVTHRLLKMASGNTIVVADLAKSFPAQLASYEDDLRQNHENFPHAYLPAAALMQWQWNRSRWTQARAAAEDAVRAAPRNALAWYHLADILSDEAQSIRQSKYSANMTAQERQAVNRIYPRSLAAALQATKLNPQDAAYWAHSAVAATFNGNYALAEKALWKAYDLDPSHNRIYSWGLQMYHPKWGGNPEQLLKVARLATQHADPNNFPTDGFTSALNTDVLKEYKQELLKAALQRAPRDAELNYHVGMIYHYDQPDYPVAEKYYRAALAADPQYARCISSLGDLTYFVHNDPQGAERLYRQAIALEPEEGHNYANLARLLASTGRRDEAMVEAKKALKHGAERSHPAFSDLGL